MENIKQGDNIVLVVQVEIVPEKLAEFIEVMKFDAVESRKEEGCLRFDLLRDQSAENKFTFYEAYKNADAFAFHKETPHYKKWADFKAAGGVVSQTAFKHDAIEFQGLGV